MTRMYDKKQDGFGVAIVVVTILVLAGLGYLGYRLYSYYSEPTISTKNDQTAQSTQPTGSQINQSTYTVVQLASQKVSLHIPSTWTTAKSSCATPPGSPSTTDYVTLIPPEKPETISGGTFGLCVNVYDNATTQTAKDWFDTNYSLASSSDQTSATSINGYDTYYLRQTNSSYDEIHYTFAASGKVVLMVARVSETGTNSSGKTVHNDFTQYLPAIQQIANSIAITQ